MANLTNFDRPRRGLRCSNRSLTRYLSRCSWTIRLHCMRATMILVRSFLLDWTEQLFVYTPITFRVRSDGLFRSARFIDCESESSDEIRQPMHVPPISRHNVSNYLINQREPSAALLRGRPAANAANTAANCLQASCGSWHLNRSSQQFSKMSRNACYSSMFPSSRALSMCVVLAMWSLGFLRLPLLEMLAGWLCRCRSHICSLVRRDDEEKRSEDARKPFDRA